MNEAILRELRKIVGKGNVSISLTDRIAYQNDHLPSSSLIGGIPSVIVIPENSEQVSKIVYLTNKGKIPLIPRGCRENQSGDNMAHEGEILLDMALMNNSIEINEINMMVTAEGGCSVYKIIWELNKRGLSFPLGPVFTCGPLIGVAVATNATGDFIYNVATPCIIIGFNRN